MLLKFGIVVGDALANNVELSSVVETADCNFILPASGKLVLDGFTKFSKTRIQFDFLVLCGNFTVVSLSVSGKVFGFLPNAKHPLNFVTTGVKLSFSAALVL